MQGGLDRKEKILNRAVFSWALYDFANSSFATTILAVVFNVYFVKVVCAGGVPLLGKVVPGASFWGYCVGISTLIVFLFAPLLGAVADQTQSKKQFLVSFCLLGTFSTSLLFFAQVGNFLFAAFFFVLANIGFAMGNSFYNAFLPEISTPQTAGWVSGFGWALGYLGGGLLLTLNLLFIQHPDWFHIPVENHLPVRFSILSVSFWWILFSIPIFIFLPGKLGTAPYLVPNRELSLISGLKELRQTFREISGHREIFKYLLAYWIYNEGIETVIVMASVFGAVELNLNQGDLILCFLMIQGVAFFGSLLFGKLADQWNHKSSIQITLWIYVGVSLWAVFMQTKLEFWILGAVVGLILGGSQAASRSLLTLLIPPEKSSQFFGFFALTGKLSTALGPVIFGLLSQFYSLRTAVGSLALFFAAGSILLYFVREPQL